MGKQVKSQWDFGELFPAEQIERKILSVTELTWQIRRLLEQHFGQIWIVGEITNLRVQASGHVYFTLKDANAQLSCVLFRGELQVDRSLLEDGRKVLLRGELTVYESRGQYQLRVTAVELHGIGALQAAFEKLKQKLNGEGLFAQERKRPLPKFPQRIGLVTSSTGAAIRDVLHVIQRRNPSLQIVLAPCRVQGEGAAMEIAGAIRLLNRFNVLQSGAGQLLASPDRPAQYLDLILLTRGGGSLEDLWAFNEQVVARAIYESALPVISAVGHEIDFTISDFVADYRAATPSAAAEIITENVFSSCQFISESGERMRQLLAQRLREKQAELSRAVQRLARMHPRRRLQDRLQLLDDLQSALLRCLRQGSRRHQVAWRILAERLMRVRPGILIGRQRELLRQPIKRLHDCSSRRLNTWNDRLKAAEAHLRLLNPEQVLARGYSITRDAQTGVVVRDARDVKEGQRLRTQLKLGQVLSTVEIDSQSEKD